MSTILWVLGLFGAIESLAARRDARIRLLRLQVELLKARVPGDRVILTPGERARLLRQGAELGHDVEGLLEIVTAKTYRRWLREKARAKRPGRVGRPRVITTAVRQLIRRLARENPGWGTRRIVGELKKLGVSVSRSSTRRVLVDEGLLPDPERHAPKGVTTPWRTFVSAQANVLVAADFFCKAVWTPFGKRMAYVLVFVHVGSRKVMLSPATFHPTCGWTQQQARNVQMWLEDEGLDALHVIRDNDTKFTAHFDAVLRQDGIETVATPFCAPIANAYAESWIGSFKRECLNHLLIFHLKQLDYITANFTRYYNLLRPHQALENTPPCSVGRAPPGREGCVAKELILGGLINHYYRKAA